MIEFESTIEIDRPAAEVFAFAADPRNVPKWNYFVLEVRKTSPGAPAVGSTYHQVRKTDRQTLRIATYDPDREVTIETVPPSSPELVRTMEFDARGDGTVLVDHWKLDTGHPGIVQQLAAGRVKAAVRENLGKLKELLETGETTLQDGRRVRR